MFKKNLLVYLVYRKTHDIELQGKIVPISLRYINRKTHIYISQYNSTRLKNRGDSTERKNKINEKPSN